MFGFSTSSKFSTLCLAVAVLSSGARAEQEVAETFGLLGLHHGVFGAPVVGYGAPATAMAWGPP
ncbi:hypothetical protein PR002_g10298 [Phytophthora rubi]|nr:hypothetical protein PR002_g10298 [Phytophthora rubi]